MMHIVSTQKRLITSGTFLVSRDLNQILLELQYAGFVGKEDIRHNLTKTCQFVMNILLKID